MTLLNEFMATLCIFVNLSSLYNISVLGGLWKYLPFISNTFVSLANVLLASLITCTFQQKVGSFP